MGYTDMAATMPFARGVNPLSWLFASRAAHVSLFQPRVPSSTSPEAAAHLRLGGPPDYILHPRTNYRSGVS